MSISSFAGNDLSNRIRVAFDIAKTLTLLQKGLFEDIFAWKGHFDRRVLIRIQELSKYKLKGREIRLFKKHLTHISFKFKHDLKALYKK